MKQILLTTAVTLLTVLIGSQANAELLMLTSTNGAQFNFDPSGATADSFNIGSSITDNGLNDIAFYLGYRNTDNTFEAPIELTNGMAVTGATSDRGAVQFAPVTFDNGVQVSALATFRLLDTSSAIGDPSASLLYDLELTTTNVPNNEGALLSLTGFDFNNNGLSDRIQPNETIDGFGTSQTAIGDVNVPIERVLAGDFNFTSFQDPVGGRTIIADNTRDDVFNGLIADNLDSLTGFAPPTFINSDGDLGFAAFADFGERDVNRTDVTAGVIGFRSTAASNVTSTVPEPSALLMASMGLGMVAFRRRKRA